MSTYKDELVEKILVVYNYQQVLADLVSILEEAANDGLDEVTFPFPTEVVKGELLRWLSLNGFTNVTISNRLIIIRFYEKPTN